MYLSTGQDALASDYKLLKNPKILPLLGLKVVVVEFNNSGEGLNALLELQDAHI